MTLKSYLRNQLSINGICLTGNLSLFFPFQRTAGSLAARGISTPSQVASRYWGPSDTRPQVPARPNSFQSFQFLGLYLSLLASKRGNGQRKLWRQHRPGLWTYAYALAIIGRKQGKAGQSLVLRLDLV